MMKGGRRRKWVLHILNKSHGTALIEFGKNFKELEQCK